MNSRPLKVLFLTLALLFSAYSLWRVYWMAQLGFNFFRWHSVLWFYIVVTLLLGAALWVGHTWWKPRSAKGVNVGGWIVLTWAAICLMEFLLRMMGTFEVYSEKREGYYYSPFSLLNKSWFYVYHANALKLLKSGDEYDYVRHTNSLGLSDKEWAVQKDSGTVRILALGDSFTEGDGAPADSSYPVLLAQLLPQAYPSLHIEVMNAGACGSDPYFEYMLLQHKLTAYRPDIVLYTNSENDLLLDYALYGGMERFLPDGKVKPRLQKKIWMDVYAISHIFRAIRSISRGSEALLSDSDVAQAKRTMYADSKHLSKLYSQLAAANGFQCVQLIRPNKQEFKAAAYVFSPDSLLPKEDLPHYRQVDLLSIYLDTLGTPSQAGDKYYWKKDGHHNATGYQLMAEGVMVALRPLLDSLKAPTATANAK